MIQMTRNQRNTHLSQEVPYVCSVEGSPIVSVRDVRVAMFATIAVPAAGDGHTNASAKPGKCTCRIVRNYPALISVLTVTVATGIHH
mmetsp:Transcript_32046/g.38998  ORF Transcript_32046/g.38998 Transcript_32046/m.38998 type:complete len:87 (+) Transcript_32046:792-1052(+)